ncbi:hypothetical protein [Longibacter salinarum]|nr:hypothetical protein [Longibacter salinarum]
MLRTLYDQSARGLPLLGRPADEARYLRPIMNHDEAARHIIRRAVTVSGTTGFVMGLPGYLTMPITVPSNVGGVLLIQLHMCATLAALQDHDPHTDTVREASIRCVLATRDDIEVDRADRGPGSSTTSRTEHDPDTGDEEVIGLIDRFTTKLGERGIRFLGEQAFRLGSYAARRANHASRSLPLLGGAIGAISDGMETRAVGDRAQRTFSELPSLSGGDPRGPAA